MIWQERKRKQVELTADDAHRLYDRTGGVPLAIVWSIAQMGLGHDPATVLTRLGRPTDDIAQFCFRETIDRISGTPAFQLLLALATFAVDANREALGFVTQLSEMDRDDGIALLEKLSLVNRRDRRFSLLPLTRNYLQHELYKHPATRDAIRGRMVSYYEKATLPSDVLRTGVPYWDGLLYYANLEVVRDEWANIKTMIEMLAEEGPLEDALALYQAIVHRLAYLGQWDARVQLGHTMIDLARRLSDPIEAWLWIDALGWVLMNQNLYDECMEAIGHGRSVAASHDMADALLLARVFEAEVYMRQGELEVAASILRPMLDRLDMPTLQESDDIIRKLVVGRLLSRSASLCEMQRDWQRAKDLWSATLSLCRAIGERSDAVVRGLIRVSLQMNDLEAAERYFNEEYLDGTRMTLADQRSASDIYALALIAEKKQDFLEAQRLAKEALAQYARRGDRSGAVRAQTLLERLRETKHDYRS